MARVAAETVFLRKLLADLDGPLKHPSLIFCDNKGALDLVKNNVHHKRTKHIDLRYFYCRDKHEDGAIRAARVPIAHNL